MRRWEALVSLYGGRWSLVPGYCNRGSGRVPLPDLNCLGRGFAQLRGASITTGGGHVACRRSNEFEQFAEIGNSQDGKNIFLRVGQNDFLADLCRVLAGDQKHAQCRTVDVLNLPEIDEDSVG